MRFQGFSFYFTIFGSCSRGDIEHSFLTQIKPNEMLWGFMHTNEMNFKRILNSLPKIEICLTFYFFQ